MLSIDKYASSAAQSTLSYSPFHLYKILCLKIHAENDAGKLVTDLFLFFKKALHEVKASCLQFSFNMSR